jgi:hypothetical protein
VRNATHDAQEEGLLPHTRPPWMGERAWAVLRGRAAGATLAELAAEMNVTRERVRQIEAAAIKRLRKERARDPQAALRDELRRIADRVEQRSRQYGDGLLYDLADELREIARRLP